MNFKNMAKILHIVISKQKNLSFLLTENQLQQNVAGFLIPELS